MIIDAIRDFAANPDALVWLGQSGRSPISLHDVPEFLDKAKKAAHGWTKLAWDSHAQWFACPGCGTVTLTAENCAMSEGITTCHFCDNYISKHKNRGLAYAQKAWLSP